MNSSIKEIYHDRISQFSTELQKEESLSSLISNVRLLIVVVMIGGLFYGIRFELNVITYITLFLGVVLFLLLVIKHNRVAAEIKRLQHLISLNQKGVDRLEGRWSSFHDRGDEFIDDEHLYSSDLDIFGKASLFQYCTTAHTLLGRENLASKLAGEEVSIPEILKRQEAVSELASDISFREDFEAAALDIEKENPQKLLRWLQEEVSYRIGSQMGFIVKMLPLISFVALLSDIFLYRTIFIPLFLYLLQTVLFALYYKKGLTLFTQFEQQKLSLQIYETMVTQIENKSFQTTFLKSLQQSLDNESGVKPSIAFQKLRELLQKADLRHNYLAHAIVNVISLWDCKVIIAITNWKEHNGSSVEKWLTVIAEFETLASLALLFFENPSWAMPEMRADLIVEGANVRHPLISQEESVGNSFSQDSQSQIAIISGSNMSGKSTFLRTIAINLVLAYAGAPVAATSFSCGLFSIITSLRTGDTINKKVSTFYAELLRIKSILDSVKSGKNTFFFIDEIFSGTNSHDRIEGAHIVLKELHKPNCLGIISTHDLELCSLSSEKEFCFVNYHFQEEYKDNCITFDYTIYPGPSTTRNAMYLMNMVGILDEDCSSEMGL